MKATDLQCGITQERLHQLLHYDPLTGVFLWRVKPARPVTMGAVAGRTHKTGYRIIKIDARPYYAHRLAWLYMTGEWPSADIDHISGDKVDNRWANMRLATRSENAINRPAPTNNTSGIKGVYLTANGRWAAMIRVRGVLHHLGTYAAKEAAADARQRAETHHFGNFARVA